MTNDISRPRSVERGPDRATGLRQHLRIDERVSSLRERLEARADVRQAERLHADIREARGHVRGWTPNRVSQDTADRYALTAARLRTDHRRPEDARCKKTFESERAAVVHVTRTELKQSLTELDRCRRSGDIDRAANAYNRIREALDTLRRYPPGTSDRELDRERTSAYRGPARAAPDRSNSKRSSLANLPEDWRDRVQAEVRQHDRPAVAVMALTGCRPAECAGARVHQEDERVTITLKGAKCDEHRGVQERVIALECADLADSQAGRDLTTWLGRRPVRTVAVQGSVEAYRERVGRAAARAGLSQVSSYTYRHAEAQDMKASGLNRSEIARRFGHRSDRSQSVYG